MIIVNETAPTEMKGQLGTLHQLMVTTGIMVPGFMGFGIPLFLGAEDDRPACISNGNGGCSIEGSDSFFVQNFWRVFFALPIAFAII
jgi:Sugar (and other) transporter